MSPPPQHFKPALVVVDVQEDFCPPNGSLMVPGGRDIVPFVNRLLQLPFASKIATKDWHPRSHVSFASNHPAPNNVPFVSTTTISHSALNNDPFVSTTTITHPENPSLSYMTLLWPDHCVQNTPGAELLPELLVNCFDVVINKGTDPRVEMYSGFTDPFHQPPFTPESTSISTSALPKLLGDEGITHVYIVGLAQDFCVKASAIDSVRFGYHTFVVLEATRAVVPGGGWDAAEKEMVDAGVKMVAMGGEEVGWVRGYTCEGAAHLHV